MLASKNIVELLGFQDSINSLPDIDRVLAMAEHVWDDVEEARLFLVTQNPALDGQRPIDAAYTELGARQVEKLLSKIFYGIPP